MGAPGVSLQLPTHLLTLLSPVVHRLGDKHRTAPGDLTCPTSSLQAWSVGASQGGRILQGDEAALELESLPDESKPEE